MPRDAASTRDALIAAGLRLFAADGVYTASLASIVNAAGQRNTSALHYHFAVDGLDARHGLLFAIIDDRNAAIEATRRMMLDDIDNGNEDIGNEGNADDLRRIVVAYVLPQAACLESADGRRFLSIVSQLIDLFDRWDEDPSRTPAQAMRSFRLIEKALPPGLPRSLRRERVARFVEMVSESLGARARRIESSRGGRVEHDDYVANLVDMAVGALSAPSSAG